MKSGNQYHWWVPAAYSLARVVGKRSWDSAFGGQPLDDSTDAVPVMPYKRPPRGPYGPRRTVNYGDNQEYSLERIRYGRHENRRSNKYARHVLRAAVKRNVYGGQLWSSFGGLYGAQALQNFQNSANSNSDLPCHIYDLTSSPNGIAGTIYQNQMQYYMRSPTTDGTGALQWAAGGGASANTGVIGNLVKGDLPASFSTDFPGASDLLRGVSVKMLLYCPTKLATRFDIQLVQFTDEDYIPQGTGGATASAAVVYPGDAVTPGTVDFSMPNDATAWWQNRLQAYDKTPVVHTSNWNGSKMRVLHTRSVILHPKETTESALARTHQLNLYFNMNRQRKFDWGDSTKFSYLTDNTENTAIAQTRCQVEPKARVFLLIRAISGFTSAASAFPGIAGNVNLPAIFGGTNPQPAYFVTPSYDISIRQYADSVGA